MVQSAALTVTQYLAELPPERRKVRSAVRALVKRNLPGGYAEVMECGMIAWGGARAETRWEEEVCREERRSEVPAIDAAASPLAHKPTESIRPLASHVGPRTFRARHACEDLRP